MTKPTQLAAYVLHGRRYGDSSLLVELLTRDLGRVVCVAKGVLRAKRPDSRVQPFQALQVDLRGRGEVQTLARAEPLDAPLPLSGRNLYCGLYLNELLIRLTARQDPHPRLFDDYASSVGELCRSGPVEPVLRRFEVRLMSHLGLGLILEHDHSGEPLVPDRRYVYDIDSGPRLATSDQGSTVTGSTLLALHGGRVDDRETLREARQLMRRIIDYHLDGRPLRSRELFR